MQHAAYRTPARSLPADREVARRGWGLEGVLGLEVRSGAFWIAAGVAVAIHLLLPWVIRLMTILMALLGLIFARVWPSTEGASGPPMEIEIAPEPPKEIVKEEPKEVPKEEPKDAPKATKDLPKDQPVAAAAQAGAVLTQEPKPDEPVDLTNSFVTGSGTAYAGGTTMAAGTATAAVRAPVAAATGVVGGTGTGVPTPAVDRSRAAGLGGSKSWNDCPFPPEADVDNIDQAAVLVQVSVGPDGRPSAVKVVSDPGHGFGRAAKACAMQRGYQTALDRDGTPVPGVFSVNVTFAR